MLYSQLLDPLSRTPPQLRERAFKPPHCSPGLSMKLQKVHARASFCILLLGRHTTKHHSTLKGFANHRVPTGNGSKTGFDSYRTIDTVSNGKRLARDQKCQYESRYRLSKEKWANLVHPHREWFEVWWSPLST